MFVWVGVVTVGTALATQLLPFQEVPAPHAVTTVIGPQVFAAVVVVEFLTPIE
jgi:hypothetical protein